MVADGLFVVNEYFILVCMMATSGRFSYLQNEKGVDIRINKCYTAVQWGNGRTVRDRIKWGTDNRE